MTTERENEVEWNTLGRYYSLGKFLARRSTFWFPSTRKSKFKLKTLKEANQFRIGNWKKKEKKKNLRGAEAEGDGGGEGPVLGNRHVISEIETAWWNPKFSSKPRTLRTL